LGRPMDQQIITGLYTGVAGWVEGSRLGRG
jgi:hypothetical protein